MSHPRCLPEPRVPRVKPRKGGGGAYLDGDGDHLVDQVLVQQADGSGQELQRAGVCFVGIDAVQQLKVHDEDVPLLQEARGNVSQSVSARDGPRNEARREGRQLRRPLAQRRGDLWFFVPSSEADSARSSRLQRLPHRVREGQCPSAFAVQSLLLLREDAERPPRGTV